MVIEQSLNRYRNAHFTCHLVTHVLRRHNGAVQQDTPEIRFERSNNEGESESRGSLERAIQCALTAHAGQLYPAPEPEPYIQHPLRVMCAVEGAHAQIAAVLHDVIEDTAITLADLNLPATRDR